MRRQLTVFSIALLCATVASAAQPAGPLDRVLGQLHDLRAARASNPKQGKISSRLLPPPTVGPLVGGLAVAPPPLAADGSLHVYLDCSPLGSAELQKLQQAGVRIERIQVARGRVQARVDASALETLAGFSWVHAIRTVDRAVVRAGSVTTEGDAASRADALRAQGLDGSGVVVGVISDGIDSVQAAQATNDLPDVVVPNDSRCQKGAGDEGTALLEIVHDVAPGAKLLFSGPASSLDMVDAVACLTDAGANVIVDDLGFFGEPYFEDGPVAAAVDAAVTAGVSYHSSAGNEAQEHLEEDFFPAAGSNGQLHDFAAGAGDPFNGVVVPAGGTLTCILQWNDPFGGAADDYDLVLLDASLNVVAESIDPQVGAQDPIEAVSVVNQTNTDQLANVLDPARSRARRAASSCSAWARPRSSTALPPAASSGMRRCRRWSPSAPWTFAIPASTTSRRSARTDLLASISRGSRFAPNPISSRSTASRSRTPVASRPARPSAPSSARRPPRRTRRVSPHSFSTRTRRLTPAEVQAALTRGAVDIGAPGFDEASGFGRLDALASAAATSQLDHHVDHSPHVHHDVHQLDHHVDHPPDVHHDVHQLDHHVDHPPDVHHDVHQLDHHVDPRGAAVHQRRRVRRRRRLHGRRLRPRARLRVDAPCRHRRARVSVAATRRRRRVQTR